MAEPAESSPNRSAARPSQWSELLRKDDWWAIWIGLGLVSIAIVLFLNGGSLKWIAVAPQKWTHLADVTNQLQQHGAQYGALFVLWAVALGAGAAALGIPLTRFLPAFIALYLMTLAIYFLGLWDRAAHYNLEPPLVALALGLVVSNTFGTPRWLATGAASARGSRRRCCALLRGRHRMSASDMAEWKPELGCAMMRPLAASKRSRRLPWRR